MHQTRKGKTWDFGMKAHIGVDAQSGLVHTVIGTPANVSDVTKVHELLHGGESLAFGDAGYRGVRGPRQRRALVCGHGREQKTFPAQYANRAASGAPGAGQGKSQGPVEHPFHVIKNRLGMKRTRYRGLLKAQLFTLFALANLLIAKGRILPREQGV
jgi:IS5 family transposase